MTTPAQMGMAQGMDPVFVWTQLAEMQKTLGVMSAKQDQHKEATAKLDEALAQVKADVSGFKQIRHTAKVLAWLVGIAAGAVVAAAGYITKEAWEVFKPYATQHIQRPAPSAPKP